MTARRHVGAAALVAATLAATGCADLPSVQPLCDDVEAMTLLAQSGPNGEEVPCMDRIPFGFSATTFDVGSDEGVWHLSHEVAGRDVVRVRLDHECESFAPDRDLTEVSFAEDEWVRRVAQDDDAYRADWVRRDEEACITITLEIDHPDWRKVLDEFTPQFTVLDREAIAEALLEETDGRLRLPQHVDEDGPDDG